MSTTEDVPEYSNCFEIAPAECGFETSPDECARADTGEALPVNEEVSRVILEGRKGQDLMDTGLILTTRDGYHQLDVDEENREFAQRLLLRSGDRLVGVNQMNVTDWFHAVVLMSLRYLFRTRDVSLLVQRRNDDSSEYVTWEIKAEVAYLSRGDGSDLITTARIGMASVLPPVTAVSYKGEATCWIRHVYFDLYLKVGRKGKIKMKPLKNRNNVKFQFVRQTFSGVQCSRSGLSMLAICMFQTKDSSASNGGYICKTGDKVRTVKTVSPRSRSADTRFFYLHQTEANVFYIQSVVSKGYFLTCSNKRPVLSVTKNDHALDFPGTFPDGAFDIIASI